MFRKTITRLAYSPALAEELTDYARKLRREEAKRQIGLIFIVLALVIQSFAVLFPPESANAGNTTDFIEGGFSTVDEYLGYYDQNTHGVRELFASLGISRADIQAMRPASLDTMTDLIVWQMASRGDSGATAYDFLKGDGTTKTAYYLPFRPVNAPAYTGLSSTGWFALLKNSGNLVTKASAIPDSCSPDSTLPSGVPVPIFLTDITRCNLNLAPTLSAQNLSASTPATSRAARASDRIMYTLAVTNNSTRTVSVPLSIGLTDILEYSQLMDKGGANFDRKTKTLAWTATTIPPGASLSRNFIIKLLPVVPSTATGQIDQSSYDCIMSVSFGTTLHVPVVCPFPKAIERIVSDLPPASLQTNLIFAVSVAVIATYFYIRSRQLRTELRLIRHNHQGTL